MIKVLNLYAGIGGNRKLWENVDVTAVELDPKIAKIYQDFFPDDKVVVTDEAGNQHMYSHLRELPEFLTVGQSVTDGQVLGYMGNTGSVFGIDGKRPGAGDTETGSHLDYRIKGKELVNPDGQTEIDMKGDIKQQLSKYWEE